MRPPRGAPKLSGGPVALGHCLMAVGLGAFRVSWAPHGGPVVFI